MNILIIFANIIAIFRKELQSYFASPLAYIVAAVFWLISGLFFVLILFDPQEGIITNVLIAEQRGIPIPDIDVVYVFFNSFFEFLGSLSLFILPILSMGLYTEERKQGTLELLATSPLTNWSVAAGKLLGVLVFFTFMIMPILVFEIFLFTKSEPAVPLLLTLLVHGGLILLAGAILSLGMFISSTTESTIIAAILSFTLVLFLWIIDSFAGNNPGIWGEVFSYLSLVKNYRNLITGVFDLSSVVVFLSYIILGVFLTAQSIENLRFNK